MRQGVNQRLDIVTSEHGAENIYRLDSCYHGTCSLTFDEAVEKCRFFKCSVVDTRTDMLTEKCQQILLLLHGLLLQQFNQLTCLIHSQWKRRDTALCPFIRVRPIFLYKTHYVNLLLIFYCYF